MRMTAKFAITRRYRQHASPTTGDTSSAVPDHLPRDAEGGGDHPGDVDVHGAERDRRPSAILRVTPEMMTTPARPRRHLASSPFGPDPEPIIEQYALDDLVSQDAYGMGRVIQSDAGAVIVDFGSRTVRITSPFPKMARL